MLDSNTLSLETGEYEITPSEEGWTARLSKMMSGGDSEIHLHDVERASGTQELEIIRRMIPQGNEGDLLRTVDEELLFREPTGKPLLSLTPAQSPSTLRDATSEEVLATWEKSFYVFGDWEVRDYTGEVVATVTRERSLRDLLPFSRTRTYTVYAADDTEIAKFAIIRSFFGLSPPTLEIALERSSVPPEIVLGFAYGIFMTTSGGSFRGGG